MTPEALRSTTAWHLSAATYRRLDEKAAYVRQRGFEPLQQERMVLQYAEKHGRITRREAAELCRLSPDQTYRLLTRLTEEGKLVRRGTRKGAWYERHVQNNRALLLHYRARKYKAILRLSAPGRAAARRAVAGAEGPLGLARAKSPAGRRRKSGETLRGKTSLAEASGTQAASSPSPHPYRAPG